MHFINNQLIMKFRSNAIPNFFAFRSQTGMILKDFYWPGPIGGIEEGPFLIENRSGVAKKALIFRHAHLL